MYKQINLYEFKNAFKSLRPDNFTYEGLVLLFDYLEGYEKDADESIELDVIALCCEFSEYAILEDALNDYGIDHEDEKAIIDFCDCYVRAGNVDYKNLKNGPILVQ